MLIGKSEYLREFLIIIIDYKPCSRFYKFQCLCLVFFKRFSDLIFEFIGIALKSVLQLNVMSNIDGFYSFSLFWLIDICLYVNGLSLQLKINRFNHAALIINDI